MLAHRPGMTIPNPRASTHYRQLGRSGLKNSSIRLGTMMFGGPTDAATSSRIMAKAREAGTAQYACAIAPYEVFLTRKIPKSSSIISESAH